MGKLHCELFLMNTIINYHKYYHKELGVMHICYITVLYKYMCTSARENLLQVSAKYFSYFTRSMRSLINLTSILYIGVKTGLHFRLTKYYRKMVHNFNTYYNSINIIYCLNIHPVVHLRKFKILYTL